MAPHEKANNGGFETAERVRVRRTPRTVSAGCAGVVRVISGGGRNWWSRKVSEYVVRVDPGPGRSDYFGVKPEDIERVR